MRVCTVQATGGGIRRHAFVGGWSQLLIEPHPPGKDRGRYQQANNDRE